MKLLFFFSIFCLSLNCYGQNQTSLQDAILLKNVTVIDGLGNPPKQSSFILIQGGKITGIYQAFPKKLLKSIKEVDLTGKYLIPGLLDAHVHLSSAPPDMIDTIMKFAFQSGITGVRDMGGDGIVLKELSQKASNKNLPVPRIYFSSVFAGKSWMQNDGRAKSSAHGFEPGNQDWLKSIDSQINISEAVQNAKKFGCAGIKIYADLSYELVQAIVEEARKVKIKVWSHAAIFPIKPRDAVKAGVNVLSHSEYLLYEGADIVPQTYHTQRNVPYPDSTKVFSQALFDLFAEMKKKNVFLDATLYVTQVRERMSSSNPQSVKAAKWTYQLTGLANKNGVKVIAGTDLMGMPGRDSISNIHVEMKLLVTNAGFSPLEAIRAATYYNALAWGIENEFGSIDVGKIADLIVLDADPSVNIDNTKKIAIVIKNGVMYKK
jgi:imidazolonepropionase-like amidohydrolase